MLYFPQLVTGSVSQFPIQRSVQSRTITNELLGGENIRAADPGASTVRWQLQYAGLTDAEWLSIAQLFQAAEGQFDTFTFLDPSDNLLVWSEDWTQRGWSADPLLTVGIGAQDPFAGSNAIQLTNNAQTTQRMKQAIGGPSWFQYCFSVFLRTDAACQVQLVCSTGSQEVATAVAVGATWNRASGSAALSVVQDGVTFSIEVPAGARVYGFGAQVEAQLAPGTYKKTTDLGGVYANARFDSDVLVRAVDGPNQNSCIVRVMSKLS